MLPYVQTEHRSLAFHKRAVLVRRAVYDELAAVQAKPSPAAAEASSCCSCERFFELVKATELLVDRFSQAAGRSAASRSGRLPSRRGSGSHGRRRCYEQLCECLLEQRPNC